MGGGRGMWVRGAAVVRGRRVTAMKVFRPRRPASHRNKEANRVDGGYIDVGDGLLPAAEPRRRPRTLQVRRPCRLTSLANFLALVDIKSI